MRVKPVLTQTQTFATDSRENRTGLRPYLHVHLKMVAFLQRLRDRGHVHVNMVTFWSALEIGM